MHEGVKSFETNRPTCLSTDWSKTGLGYTLTQKHCSCPPPAKSNCGNGHWKLVFAGSRFTTPPESRYAPIEGETLAVAYGLQSCRMFVMGCPDLIVAVDHKPLLKILNDRQLETISNPRILQLKEKMLMFQFKIQHIPGIYHNAADAASRYPCQDGNSGEYVNNETTLAFVIHQANGIQSLTWPTIAEAALTDEEHVALVKHIQSGFPDLKSDVPELIQKFWPMRDDMYV